MSSGAKEGSALMLALRTAPGTAVRLTSPTPADLVRTTELAPGLTVEIDLADPSRWHAVEVRDWAAADPALLNAVLGRPAVRLLSSGMPHIGEPIDVTPAPAWRRLAVLDALDWWLQLPLNQGLLDAERAIARARAAASLPAGLLRHALVDRAVVHARRSADDVTTYLNGLNDSLLPRALFTGLARLVTGYAALRQEVDGPDAALSAVLTAWNRLKSTGSIGLSSTFEPDDVRLARSAVDPRQLRARIAGDVQLTPDPYGTSVRVVVPAFVPMPSALVADRVMVRLVDQRSGEAQEPVLLTLRSGAFTETVPLRGTPVEYVRADVFDADSAVQPAQSADLVRARRAQLVLSEWRRAVAESRLSRSVRPRNHRLTRLLDAIAPTKRPLFRNGPARADVLDAINGTTRHPWFGSTTGAGAPLVAELAAAHTNH
jgi:hypothetical protein